jgi:molecular chaperone DnaK (HSP70)
MALAAPIALVSLPVKLFLTFSTNILPENKSYATMSVVGIDFGYSNAVIAAAGRGGVDILLNGNSNRLNP